MICKECKHGKQVHGKDYVLCSLAQNKNKNKNPYRTLNDLCPNGEKK